MRFLFVSRGSHLLPLAFRCQEAGHVVAVVSDSLCGGGIVPVYPWPQLDTVLMQGFDIGVVGGSGLGRVREALHRRFPTIGPTVMTDNIVADEDVRYKFFSLLDVDATPGPVAGIEVVTGGWFNGHNFVMPLFSQLWLRRQLVGNLGPLVDPPAGMIGYVHNGPTLICSALLGLEKALAKCDYRGPVALCADVTERNYRVLEVVFDIRAFEIFLDGIKDTASLLSNVARGEARLVQLPHGFYCGVRFWGAVGTRVGGLVEENLRHLLLTGVSDVEGTWIVTGPVVGLATAYGQKMGEARRRAYRTLETVLLPDIAYRNDVGRDTPAMYQRLKEQEWF